MDSQNHKTLTKEGEEWEVNGNNDGQGGEERTKRWWEERREEER